MIPRLWGIRCWLGWCPCELRRFGKNHEELWAACVTCGEKRVFMNDWKFETRKEPPKWTTDRNNIPTPNIGDENERRRLNDGAAR